MQYTNDSPKRESKLIDECTRITILIPAFNPDGKLVELVDELSGHQYGSIIVVNDGSDSVHNEIFETIAGKPSVSVLHHKANAGKGEALKTGLRSVMTGPSSIDGVITADADGQHLPVDIRQIAAEARRHPENIILGCRTFGPDTPIRSRFGNHLTLLLMSFVHNIRVSDTQTGLRYLPTGVLPEFTDLPGSGYEYELQCLVQARKLGYAMREVPISTVYIDENASSHFQPIRDSIRVYSALFRFGGSAALSFSVDVGLFALIYHLTDNALLATAGARLVSGTVNFCLNKFVVFRQRELKRTKQEAMGYFTLWITLLLLSGLIVSIANGLPTLVVVPLKILVDTVLFLLNYYLQSRFVFAKNKASE